MATELTETDDGELVIPDEVYSQLEALRESGAVNMLTEVKRGLREMEFDTALAWVEDNEEPYFEHAMSGGFCPASEYED